MEEEEEELYFTYRQHQDSSRRSWQAISTRKTRTTWKTLRWEITNTSECFIICICKPLVMFRTLKKTKNNLTLSPESPGLPGGPEAPGGPGRPYFKQKTSFNFYIYTQYNTRFCLHLAKWSHTAEQNVHVAIFYKRGCEAVNLCGVFLFVYIVVQRFSGWTPSAGCQSKSVLKESS